jgi:hypothetical protein
MTIQVGSVVKKRSGERFRNGMLTAIVERIPRRNELRFTHGMFGSNGNGTYQLATTADEALTVQQMQHAEARGVTILPRPMPLEFNGNPFPDGMVQQTIRHEADIGRDIAPVAPPRTDWEIGDRVQLNPESRWAGHGTDSGNPVGVNGTITHGFGRSYNVDWDNGRSNSSYSVTDLLPAIPTEIAEGVRVTLSPESRWFNRGFHPSTEEMQGTVYSAWEGREGHWFVHWDHTGSGGTYSTDELIIVGAQQAAPPAPVNPAVAAAVEAGMKAVPLAKIKRTIKVQGTEYTMSQDELRELEAVISAQIIE